MKKVFSIKELALIGILIVVAAYYFVVQGPVASQTAELTRSGAELQSQIDISQVKAAEISRMQSELDKIYERAGGEPQSLASYSNNKVLLQELNVYMDMAEEFDISFGSETITDNVMRREINISYKTLSKEAAEYIAELIEDSRNTYLITGFAANADSSSHWSATLSLVNYEYVSPEQTAELTKKKNIDTKGNSSADKTDQSGVLESLAGMVN